MVSKLLSKNKSFSLTSMVHWFILHFLSYLLSKVLSKYVQLQDTQYNIIIQKQHIDKV